MVKRAKNKGKSSSSPSVNDGGTGSANSGKRKRSKYVLPFLTRCAPKQFMDLCNVLKHREDKMRRLKDIGFDKLVKICCPQINRDLCRELIRAFDAPTNKIRIRGKTYLLGPNDVKTLMGLPCGKKEIKINIKEEDKDFQALRGVCGKIAYNNIAEWLIDEVDDENFELLFVMYALGTLLCPTASVCVTDKVLKVILETDGAFGEYNWCSFIFNELSNSIGKFKKAVRSGKNLRTQTVRGCIYFLMIYCLQHFPFGEGKASKAENAIEYWDEMKVKERIQMEKDSNDGLLLGVSNVVGSSYGKFNPDVLVHPGLRTIYGRLLSVVGKELLAIQSDWLNESVNEEVIEHSKKEEEEIQEVDEDEEEDNERYFEVGQYSGKDDIEIQWNEERNKEDNENATDIEKEDLEKEENEEAAEENENTLDESEQEKEENEEGPSELRRSTRIIIPAVRSPWIETKRKGRVKRENEDRDALFQMCMSNCNEKEGGKYFVEMYGYYLKRVELHCLRPRAWINDRFMSMVAKTLVGDEKVQYGQVRRHIFSADFMAKMKRQLHTWCVEDNEKEFLPEHLGYNIGDCDFVFGPTIFNDHWFCFVVEPKTMRFYALDSLVDSRTFIKLQREQEAAAKGKKKPKPKASKKKKRTIGKLSSNDFLASCIQGGFYQMLRIVKPSLFEGKHKIDNQVIWAKVHVQCDTDSCGVHVLSWLQMWDGKEKDDEGYTMPKYSREELQELKKGCLWWLVTHPKNVRGHQVLSMLQGNHQKRKKA